MPRLTEAELKTSIKEKKFSNLYLIYGEEKYLIKHYTNLLTKKIVSQDFADFNFHVYDGKNIDLDEVSGAAEALPMMSEYTCILIKDMQIDTLNESTLNDLISLISDISESTVIVFSMLTIEIGEKNAKAKKIIAEFEKFGAVINFSRIAGSQLVKLIEKGASQRGCELSYSEANYFISLVGDNMSVVLNELEKVCAYKKEGKIAKSDIDAVVVKSVQAKAFDLSKALVANNCDTAMEILDSLIAMKEEPINILGAIITPYVDMYRAKVYVSGSVRAEDAAKDFNYRNKEFRLTNGARFASKYSIAQLRMFLDVLYDADKLLKSSGINGRLILEQTITKLLLVSNGEKI